MEQPTLEERVFLLRYVLSKTCKPLKQQDFAALVGVKRKEIWRWETGRVTVAAKYAEERLSRIEANVLIELMSAVE